MPSEVTLISRSPAEFAEKIDPGSSIVLTFSGPVKAGMGRVEISDGYSRLLFAEPMSSSFIRISGNTVTIDPPRDFLYGRSIYVSFTENWLLDEQGAALSIPDAYNFAIALSPTALYLRGTEMPDVLHGSDLGDFLDGNGGSDKLWGHGGDDILIVGDRVSWMAPSELHGGDGSDKLYGGSGGDKLFGDAGNDQLFGGDGRDFLFGGAGNDVLDGGAGDDQLSDDEGNNTILGGAGDDTISAYGGGCVIDGGEGDDQITALPSDTVMAGDGNDLISLWRYALPGSGNGSVDGGAGDDTFEVTLRKAASSLTLTGGSGKDTFRLSASTYEEGTYQYAITDFQAGAGGDQLDLTSLIRSYGFGKGNPFAPNGFLRLQADGNDTLLILKAGGNAALLRLKDVAPSQLTRDNFVGGYTPDGSNYGVTLVGTVDNDELKGTELGDKLIGGDGNDRLLGHGGNDLLRAGDGDDVLYGGDGNDRLEGNEGDDELYDAYGDDTLLGGAGNDHIAGGGLTFLMDGGAGDDSLSAGLGGSGSLFGGAGNDALYIATGYLYGGYSGTIRADGGDGDDTIAISGDFGTVTIAASGGAGRDTFDLRSAAGNTISVTDFMVGTGGDRIEVGALAPYNFQGDPFGAAGYLRWRQVGQDAVLELDADGLAGAAHSWRELATFSNVNAAGFTRDNFKTLSGGDGGDELRGDFLENTLQGWGGNDILSGGAGKDVLRGGDGNDQLDGGDGDDQIDGGPGFDVAHLARTRDSVKIWADHSGFKVQDLSGQGGTDTLTGVERLRLADATVALDIDGVAGQIFRLYTTAFDRKPDMAGAGFWINAADSGVSLATIAEGFVTSDEFKTLYGSAPTNEQLVNAFYFNVLHFEANDAERAYWIDMLNRKAASVSSVLIGISESEMTVRTVAEIVGAGFEYTPWMG